MAHIKKLSNGRWQARYRNHEDRREVARNFSSKRAAQDWLDGVTASIVRNDYADPRGGRVKVGEVAERWYETTASLKPSTRDGYRRLLDVHVLPNCGSVELRRVTSSAVAAWSSDLASRRSASTTRKALVVLGQVLDVALADRLVAVNPARSRVVRVPRPVRREMRVLTPEELERLVEAMPAERDRVLVLVLGWTGLRFGEAAALERGDVQLLGRRLRIVRSVGEVGGAVVVGTPKTHQARTVALPPSVADALGEYMGSVPRDPEALLFTGATGTYLRPRWKARVFDKAAAAAGLTPPRLRVHDLRHTAASLWIASGASVKVVQQQLGHKSAAMTLDVYGHLIADELEVSAERLDALRIVAPADSLRTPASVGKVVAFGDRP